MNRYQHRLFLESAGEDPDALVDEEMFMSEWLPIETAPKDGTHFLACYADGSSFNERPPTVVHWWGHQAEEGFYTSVNEMAPERPFQATHWMPLPEPPVTTDEQTK